MKPNLDTLEVLPFFLSLSLSLSHTHTHTSTHAYTHGVEHNSDKISRMVKGTKSRILK